MKKILLFLSVLLILQSASANTMADMDGVSVNNVKVPFYKRGALESMIFADRAEYRAQLLYGHNVIINMLQTKVNPDQIRNDWQLKLYPLNASLKEIIAFWRGRSHYCDAVIYTPESALNQAEQSAASDREVKFRSPLLDLDGIGFASDFKKRQIKVNSDVHLILRNQKSDPRLFKGNAPARYDFMRGKSDMLHMDNARKRILLLGRVAVDDGSNKLTCDRLTVILSDNKKQKGKSNTDFSGVTMIYADGNVKVEKILPPKAPATASQELKGDHLVYDIAKGVMTVTGDSALPEIRTGKGFILRGKKLVFFREKNQLIVPADCWMKSEEKGQKRFLSSDYGNFNFKTGVCDFLGRVRGSSLQDEIACSKMRVFLERPAAQTPPAPAVKSGSPLAGSQGIETGSLDFKRALCKGDVKLLRREKQGFSLLRSDEAELNYHISKAFFTGRVHCTSNGNTLTSSRLIVNLKKSAADSRKQEVESVEARERVKITGTPDAQGNASVLTADKGFFDYRKDRVDFTGNVSSTSGKSTLTSDRLELYLAPRKAGETAVAIPGVAAGAAGSGKTLKRAVATGRAVMNDGKNALSGDRIEYFFVPAAPGAAKRPGMFQSGSLRLVKVTSSGNVKLKSVKTAEPSVPGENTFEDKEKSANAGVMLGRNGGFRELTAQSMVSDLRSNVTCFEEKVLLTDGASRMNCEKLELFSKLQQKQTPDSAIDADPFDLPAENGVPSTIAIGNGLELDRAIATKNVVINRRENALEEGTTVYCDRAFFNSSAMTVECTSTDGRRPKAVNSGKTHSSDKFTIFLKDERIESSGEAITE